MYLRAEVLSEKDLLTIHENTLELLNKYGITIKHEETKKIFMEHGATAEGNRIKLPPELVMKALSSVPSSFRLTARNQENSVDIGEGFAPVFSPCGGTVFVSDYAGGRRLATIQDLRNFHALSQTSKVVKVACAPMMSPSDLPDETVIGTAILEALKICDKPLIGYTLDREKSEQCINMARIATEGGGEHFVLGIVDSLSPMAWDDKMLECIITYAENNQPVVVTCCSMSGFTSPTTLSATVIQNNAEILTGIVLSQLVRPGVPVVYGNTSTITDMGTVNLCIGAPEYQIISTAASQLARYYKIPYRSGGGLNDSKEIDMQAGIEASTNLLLTIGNGVNFVLHAVGIMESFMTISYEKWIWDEEIIERVTRMTNDNFRLLDDVVDMIGTTSYKGNFIDHEDTLRNFKRDFYRTPVSNRESWDNWNRRGMNCQTAAHGIWQKRLREFEPNELSPSILKELKNLI